MTEKHVTVINRTGVHTRPAGCIMKVAVRFTSKITIINEAEKTTANAKSIMSIITLGAGYKSTLLVRAEGLDEKEAVEALCGLFERRFDIETE